MDTATKTRETRLRRAAKRQGFELHKSRRRRDPRATTATTGSPPETTWLLSRSATSITSSVT